MRTSRLLDKLTGRMSESRRQTRSTGTRRQNQQSDAQFWSHQPDPLLIKRGQTEAIQLVQSRINPTTTAETTEVNTATASGTTQMVFVDGEGLEEQFLTEDETSQEVTDITTNQVTTPRENETAPLDPIYTQLDIGDVFARLIHGVISARQKPMQHKPAEGMQTSSGTIRWHPVEGQHQYKSQDEQPNRNHYKCKHTYHNSTK